MLQLTDRNFILSQEGFFVPLKTHTYKVTEPPVEPGVFEIQEKGHGKTAMPLYFSAQSPTQIHERLSADEKYRDKVNRKNGDRDHGDFRAAADAP